MNPSLPGTPPERRGGWTRGLGVIVAATILLAKFAANLKFVIAPLLKFLPVILKSGGSMLLMVGVYSGLWGWKYAVGFVVLLLLHEMGHLIAARRFGLKVGAPVFVPFMGAFIALKDAPRNAWIEAWVGIGGPLLGSAAALVAHGAGEVFGAPLLVALAWTGYWLNLFNLTPIGQLDGGRIVTALSPWLWVAGLALMGWMAWTQPHFIIILILLLSIPRVISLFRRRSPEEQRFYEVTPPQRWLMGTMYFGLIAALALGMHVAELDLRHRVHAGSAQAGGHEAK